MQLHKGSRPPDCILIVNVVYPKILSIIVQAETGIPTHRELFSEHPKKIQNGCFGYVPGLGVADMAGKGRGRNKQELREIISEWCTVE